ncbi:MAG: hypothetical protein AAF764_09445 [Pseudomonadota bacterium]
MNNRPLLITIACGLLTAFLAVAPVGLGGFGLLLSLFTLVPLLVASLSVGPRTAVLAGVISTIAVAVTMGITPALATAGFTVLPTLYIGYIAGLSRDDNEDGVMEWYPLSRILFQVAIIAALSCIAYGLAVGYDVEATTAQFIEAIRSAPTATPEIEGMAEVMARSLPLAMPVSLAVLYIYSMSLAARISRGLASTGSFGLSRPKDHLPTATALPIGAVGIFAASIVTILMGGTSTIGVLGIVFAGAFGAMFTFVGLATIHHLSRNLQGRGVMLIALYGSLLVVSFLIVIPLIVGLAETLLGWRARSAANHPNT